MYDEPSAGLLRSQLVRHPDTGELFMIDRDERDGLLALAGPLARRRVWTGHAPRALISLGSGVDWFVRPTDSEDPDAAGENVIQAVLGWAERIIWQPVAVYRRVDEFADASPTDEEAEAEPRFVRTVYLLESRAAADAAPTTSLPPAPPGAPEAPPPPLWSGPGPVSLG